MPATTAMTTTTITIMTFGVGPDSETSSLDSDQSLTSGSVDASSPPTTSSTSSGGMTLPDSSEDLVGNQTTGNESIEGQSKKSWVLLRRLSSLATRQSFFSFGSKLFLIGDQ